uniref:Uncharacterized protein n=1 Tax=Caenorhabditis japonica TaxID=281687 RepID=A0A8R1IWT1_CAEJA
MACAVLIVDTLQAAFFIDTRCDRSIAEASTFVEFREDLNVTAIEAAARSTRYKRSVDKKPMRLKTSLPHTLPRRW